MVPIAKDKINWLPNWINVVVKIIDLSVSYSYSKRRDEFRHKCHDHIDIIGEVVFSDYRNIKKGETIKLLSIVDHNDEIKELDQKINPRDKDGNWRSITIRQWDEEQDIYKCVGCLEKNMMHIQTDDRFWDRYALMKLHNHDVYLILDCKREKGRKPKILNYHIADKFDIKDYEGVVSSSSFSFCSAL